MEIMVVVVIMVITLNSIRSQSNFNITAIRVQAKRLRAMGMAPSKPRGNILGGCYGRVNQILSCTSHAKAAQQKVSMRDGDLGAKRGYSQ